MNSKNWCYKQRSNSIYFPILNGVRNQHNSVSIFKENFSAQYFILFSGSRDCPDPQKFFPFGNHCTYWYNREWLFLVAVRQAAVHKLRSAILCIDSWRIMTRAKSFKHQVIQAPNHSSTKSFKHRIIQAPNHSSTKSFKHHIIQAQNHSCTKTFKHQVIQAPNHSSPTNALKSTMAFLMNRMMFFYNDYYNVSDAQEVYYYVLN